MGPRDAKALTLAVDACPGYRGQAIRLGDGFAVAVEHEMTGSLEIVGSADEWERVHEQIRARLRKRIAQGIPPEGIALNPRVMVAALRAGCEPAPAQQPKKGTKRMVAKRYSGLRVVADESGTVIPQGTEKEFLTPSVLDTRGEELAALLDRYEPVRIRIADLRNVDKAYQREKRERVVKGIVREPIWAALGAPLVSRRADGAYWVIDGQNRIASVRAMLGDEYRLLCVVVPDLTQEQEARVFTIINGNKTRSNTSAVEEFRAALTAKDEQALAINAVLEDLGLSVGTTRSPRCLQAAGALVGIWERGRPGDLKRVLQVILDAWRDDPMAFKGVVISGVYAFLARYRNEPKLRRERLIERLADTKPKNVAALGQDIRKDALRSGSLNAAPTTCFARAVLQTYNGPRQSSLSLPGWYDDSTAVGR